MSENKTSTKPADNKEAAKPADNKEAAKETAASKKNEAAKIKAAQGESSYLPEEKERHLFHVKLDKPAFNPKDGKKLSKAYIQKFTVAEYNQFAKNGSGLGYTAEVLWNPELYK